MFAISSGEIFHGELNDKPPSILAEVPHAFTIELEVFSAISLVSLTKRLVCRGSPKFARAKINCAHCLASDYRYYLEGDKSGIRS
nr:hypothetical protein [Colwellia sp. MB02u-10]